MSRRPWAAGRAAGASRWLPKATVAVGLALSVLSAWAATDGPGYWVDLARQFPAQYAGALTLCAALLVAWRRVGMAFVLLPALVWNVALLSQRYQPPNGAGRPSADALGLPDRGVADTVDILYFNVLGNNPRHAELAAFIARSGADVAVIAELRPPLARHLEESLPGWVRLVAEARGDNFGIGMWLADAAQPELAVGHARVVELVEDEQARPSIEARLRWAGREARLLGVHLVPPTSPRIAARRAVEARALAAWTRRRDGPVIVVGDLNTGPWGIDFATLTRAGLLDGGRGFGLQPTWPARLPPGFRIPLDHVLHTTELEVIEHHVGPDLGSDHLALRARLRWREP